MTEHKMHQDAIPPQPDPTPWREWLFVGLQYLLPHHLLGRLMYQAARCQWPALKDWTIGRVIRWYRVDMSEAREPDRFRYPSFNAFFTRALKPDARPMRRTPKAVLCPADGRLSQCGPIVDGRLFQAKGRDYSLLELLGGDRDWAAQFSDGVFATIYLSPQDYHRVHMPRAGTLRKMLHVPGRLFSVNPATTRLVPRLFARNERVVCLFDTDLGPMAVILVGAIFVASIDTPWTGTITPSSRQIGCWHYGALPPAPVLEQGAEMGRFNMGSTVILLFPGNTVQWTESLQPGAPMRMGARIGQVAARGRRR